MRFQGSWREGLRTLQIVSRVDTSVMPCDCLTKKMKPDNLREIMDSNYWDPRQTEEAKAQKANRQQQRQRKPVKLPPLVTQLSVKDDDVEDLDT